jgi:hypothetical protein
MFRRVLLATVLSSAFITGASAATVTYSAKLSGAKEVPKTTTKGTGTFDGKFDTTTKVLSYTLTFDGLSGPATAAHIHGPAKKGENAGVVAPLGDKNPSSPITGSVTLTDDQAKAAKSVGRSSTPAKRQRVRRPPPRPRRWLLPRRSDLRRRPVSLTGRRSTWTIGLLRVSVIPGR